MTAGGARSAFWACVALLLGSALTSCRRETPEPEPEPSASTPASSASSIDTFGGSAPAKLDLLHLGEEAAPPSLAENLLPGFAPPTRELGRCPAEMVDVRGEFCIDRFEATLVDARDERELSPFYHPTRAQTHSSFQRYRRDARPLDRAPAFPDPPSHQLEHDPRVRARSLGGVVPQGYLNVSLARQACEAAGKRLCTLAEWVSACRGQQNRKYPYGESYVHGKCNVFRASHPSAVLHGDASRQHLDPRLNLVTDAEGPLLRRTGQTSSCRSEWGSDAVFDMVGNLDEWLDDGSFAGGFYARATREGCDARISSHAAEYFDYSLGTRCCRSFSPLGH